MGRLGLIKHQPSPLCTRAELCCDFSLPKLYITFSLFCTSPLVFPKDMSCSFDCLMFFAKQQGAVIQNSEPTPHGVVS